MKLASDNSINNRSFLWMAFLSSVLGVIMLGTNAFWFLSKTLALSLWTALAGYAAFSFICLPKSFRAIIRILCLIASVAVLYDVLDVLPKMALTDNCVAWLLFGMALSTNEPKKMEGKASVYVFIIFFVSILLFIAFSWLRLSRTARTIPNWMAYKDIFQTGRIVFLYLTIFLSFAVTRIECVNQLVCNRFIKWGMVLMCVSFAVVSVFFRNSFWRQWYGTVQFVIQPVFLYAAASAVIIVTRWLSRSNAPEEKPAAVTKFPCKYDVFISYRKAGGAELADLVKSELKHRGYKDDRIFMDTHSLSGGDFRENIREAIKSSANIILVLSKDCFSGLNEDSTFLFEIRTALEAGVNIIPFCFNGTAELVPSVLPEDMAALQKSNAVIYSHDYPSASYDRLKSFLVVAKKPFPVKKVLLAVLLVLLMVASWIGGYLITPKLPIQEIEQEILGK